jgi:hypothetical protein
MFNSSVLVAAIGNASPGVECCAAGVAAPGSRLAALLAHFNNCTRQPWVRDPGGRLSSSRRSARRGPISDQCGF